MSKKNRNEKEAARLRREVEILKAQLAGVRPDLARRATPEGNQTESKAEPVKVNSFRTTPITDYSYLKKDLARTAFFSVAALASIFLIYFYLSPVPR